MPFITFEGIEGCGKTTQLRWLAERLGGGVAVTREPGGTAIGTAVRQVLLDPKSRGMTPMAELLLYFADRAQNVAEIVRPALAEGRVVLCDRHVESSLAYQGYGRGLSLEAIRELALLATGGLRPDLIVLVDVPVEVGLARVGQRGAQDRLETEVREFHERVRAGYESLLAEEPSRWMRLDGTAPPAAVSEALWSGLVERGLVAGSGAMRLDDVRGHDRVRAILGRAIERDRLPPALLFAGPDGVGKKTLALAVAQAAMCERPAPGASPAASAVPAARWPPRSFPSGWRNGARRPTGTRTRTCGATSASTRTWCSPRAGGSRRRGGPGPSRRSASTRCAT